MTLDELYEAASRLSPLDAGMVSHVNLVLLRTKPPAGRKVWIAGGRSRSGPGGEVLNVQQRPDGRYDVVASFSATKIRKLVEDIRSRS